MNIHQKMIERYNANARDLPLLRTGDNVLIQDPITKRWTKVGEIIGVGKRRDYHVKLPSGRTYWRNRRFLRKCSTTSPPDVPSEAPDDLLSSDDHHEPMNDQDESTDDPEPPQSVLRRSSREKKLPDRFSYTTVPKLWRKKVHFDHH